MRTPSRTHVLGLTHPPIPIVRLAFIGLDSKGVLTLQRYLQIEGIEIKAFCEIREGNLTKAQKILRETGYPQPDDYTGPDGWEQMCERNNTDLMFICADWLTYTPMAVYAMEHGKHVAIEVPAAMTIEECWKLIGTAKKTRQHCMMPENCCYNPLALTTLDIAQQGVFGEITHVEGAYIYDLHSIYFADESKGGFHSHWGRKYSIEHTDNPYPTYGLGPICQVLSIHRGDHMNYLVSLSSLQAGMTSYARRTFGENSPEARQKYRLENINATLIHTMKDKSIMVQYSVVIPRPYGRLHTICSTEGFAQKYPVPYIAFESDVSAPLRGKALEDIMECYKRPFTATYGARTHWRNLPNEMNYAMNCHLVRCLHNRLPLDADVYDAAEWSCITELGEQSVLNGNTPVEIPDFTRGAWKNN